ncbi:uncharacterized protein PV09_00763 [Verruconis gallopava]|uniref:Uncharacterized protein n=1 Tax=Verruconis gallopava TaxID=253628 RepID=A0A0D2BBS8_9PEZI|nr:uncharacterized protein PV09_00763 [Verruconis gallopava]KIW08834.1 hypothetical protein PV09_00763 [Verruconis gallopava]
MSNPGLPPYRRTSYASIVQGGSSSGNASAQGHPSSSSPLSSRPPISYPGASYPPSAFLATGRALYGHNPTRRAGPIPGMDVDTLASSWGRSQGLHAAVGSLSDDLRLPPFFVPSYLCRTRQARRLAEAHAARVAAAQRDGSGGTAAGNANARSAHSSNAGSLSTSSSSVNVHKMVPSHRGMTHDIIERAPPSSVGSGDDAPAPLPTRWQVGQDVTGIELSNGATEARYTGQTKQPDEAAGVRGDVPIPRECGIFYYEVTVGTKQKENAVQISVGFSGHKVTARRMPGWEPDSYGYAADDGCLLLGNSNSPKKYGPPYGNGDVIGCGINFNKNHIFFTKNGNHLGIAVTNIRHDRMYPAVGLKRADDNVRVNFGQSQFVFDIDSLVETEREEVRAEMMAAPVDQLARPMSEPEFIHKLIAQYLAHDGYIETARAFAAEVRQEHLNLVAGRSDPVNIQDLEPQEDVDAIHRQKIRSAILDGDIDRALKYTTVYYPDVLRDNENIYFKLKCRKFIEMIRRCTELSDSDSSPLVSSGLKFSSGDDDYNGVFGHQMELDDQAHANGSVRSQWDDMEMSADDLGQQPQTYADMISRTLQYGSELKAEFDGDLRREVKKSLEETLALIGYEDPRQSPLRHLLDERERGPVAEELNRAILVSLGKSSSSAIEKMFAQTDALLDIIGKDGGPGALIELRSFPEEEASL